MHSFLKRKKASQKGQSFVELCAGVLALIPITLLCFDLSTLCLGANLNDTVCRDAARCASVGPPDAITSGEPLRRAKDVATRTNRLSGAVRLDLNSIAVSEVITNMPSAAFGGAVDGQVTVTTSVHVYPLFLLSRLAGQEGI